MCRLCRIFYFLCSSLVCVSLTLSMGYAQSFVDPSFEGATFNGSYPPLPWIRYDPWPYTNTPDHQPGRYGVSRPAFHGEKFVGMVCRPDSSTETIGHKLDLLPNTDYYFSVYLAHTDQYQTYGNRPGTLRVLGRKTSNSPFFLMWSSPTIDHLDWQKYWVSIRTPSDPVEFLFFQAYYSPLSFGRAGVLIDSVGEIKIGKIPQVDLGLDTVLCNDETLLLNVFVDSATYLWQDGSTEPQLLVTEPGAYSVTSSLNGFTFSDEVVVGYRYIPEIELGTADTSLCDGLFLEINADLEDPEVSYSWNTGESEPFLTIREPGIYQVKANKGRCYREDEISVSYRNCDLALVMPNVMSPNGDGINDAFVPVEIKDVYAPQLSIYNRWGKMIYSARSLDPAWDGRTSAGPVPEGVYYWAIQYEDAYGTQYRDKGELLLVR